MKQGGLGFTLIELLVVMSIISMLMSILLPGLSRSREIAKRVDCLSQQRQLYLGWNLYGMDHDDAIPSSHTLWNNNAAGSDDDHWVADGPPIPGNPIGGTELALEEGALWSYVAETEKIFRCKSDRSELLRSYSISWVMGGSLTGTGISGYYSTTQITRPTEKIVFVDAEQNIPYNWIHGGFYPLDDAGENARWSSDSRQLRQMSLRHTDGFNISFADGHSEYYKYQDPRTVRMLKFEISADQAKNDNEDLINLAEMLEGD